jgi:hypothetical protein
MGIFKLLAAPSVFVCLLQFAWGETFSERFEKFDIRAEKIFYTPEKLIEKDDYRTGLMNAWREYSTGEAPDQMTFRDYTLFADPIHVGQRRISFLLGSDCSHFVHRLYQLLGVDFPYLKTRHWLSFAKNEKPADISDCRWKKVQEEFSLVPPNEIKNGDVFVFAKKIGEFGEYGHMGIVTSVAPFKFLNVNLKRGFTNEEADVAELIKNNSAVFFRYKVELANLDTYELQRRFLLNFNVDNSGCAAQ